MKDMVTNQTGNSRYLKTALPSGTSWEDALAMLRAGTFPVDFAGLNSGGIAQQGSAYSKANVLPQDVCTALGLTESTAEPKDAFAALKSLASSAYTLAEGRARAEDGSYIGTGTYGSENPNSLTFPFPIKLFVMSPSDMNGTTNGYLYIIPGGVTRIPETARGSNAFIHVSYSNNNQTISWYSSNSSGSQNNGSGKTINYVAFG